MHQKFQVYGAVSRWFPRPDFAFMERSNVSGPSRSLKPPPHLCFYFVRWTFLFHAAALPMANKHSPQSSVESVASFSSYGTSDSVSIETDETHVNIPGDVRYNDSVGSLNGHESAYLYFSHSGFQKHHLIYSRTDKLAPPGLDETYRYPAR